MMKFGKSIVQNESDDPVIQNLRRDGLHVLDPIPKHKIEEFNNYLSDKETWDKHVKFHAQGRPGIPGKSSSMCWSMEDVILAPNLFDISLEMTPYAEAYLGQQPRLYSINSFITNPIDGPTQADIQEFHRDIDDTRFIGLFVFCTDVLTPEDGAHEFVLGSHLDTDHHQPVGDRKTVTLTGEAGTMFLAVTWGWHRGLRPKTKPRTLFWSRWGVSDEPWSYGWDHLTPVNSSLLGDRYPQDEKMKKIIELVVK